MSDAHGTHGTGNRGSVPDSGQQPPNGQPGGGQFNQQSDENNTNNNETNPLESLWEEPVIEDGNQQQQQQQNQQQNQQQQSNSPAEAFNEHVKSLGLTDNIDTGSLFEAAREGDSEAFNNGIQESLQTVAANTYRAALNDANKIVDAKVEQAVTKAVREATGSFEVDKAVTALNTALPFTKSPMVAPIAKSVLGQFMKKGMSLEDAIDGTRDFFAETNKLTAKDLGNQRPNNRPGGGNFNQQSNIPTDSDEEPDWMEMLTDSNPNAN